MCYPTIFLASWYQPSTTNTHNRHPREFKTMSPGQILVCALRVCPCVWVCACVCATRVRARMRAPVHVNVSYVVHLSSVFAHSRRVHEFRRSPLFSQYFGPPPAPQGFDVVIRWLYCLLCRTSSCHSKKKKSKRSTTDCLSLRLRE